MHNLGTVISFEIVRTLKKKSFWFLSLIFPLMIGAIFAIIYFSNQTTNEISEKLANQQFSLAIKDESKLIKPAVVQHFKATEVTNSAKAIEQVKNGQLDAFIEVPPKLHIQKIKIYAKDVGIFENSRYQAAIEQLLSQSIDSKFSPSELAVVTNSLQTDTVTYRDGQTHDGIKEAIIPGLFLILLYLLVTTFGGQMLTSTTEEKENRVIEMILTTVKAKTLIVGKILSLIILGFTQVLIIMVPVLASYLLLRDKLDLPTIDLSSLPVDPTRIALGFGIFVLSFLMFTGLLVAIGAATPTAKEANGFFGVVMILLFGPLYAVSLFVSAPDSPLVQFLSYFPFTAPIPLLLRNSVGNLGIGEAMIAMALLLLAVLVVMTVAVRAFRSGSLEYSRRLSLREIFRV